MATPDDQDPDAESGLYSTWIQKVAGDSGSRRKLLDQLDAICPHPGDRIGAEDRFEIVERLGIGGMSVVFRARDRRLHRDVAVKFLLSSPAHKDRTADLLGNEARAVARLNHENIVSIFDISTWSGIPFIVMELVDGKPLDLLLGERTPVGRATSILLDISRGVRHAHERGIIHRDLKPSNIFIRADGKPKVLDFGLVWFDPGFSEGGEAWTPDLVLRTAGTPTYMSPEQWRGEPQDACTDIWALGMIYYALLSGAPPYGAAGVNVRERALSPDPVPLPDAASLGVPEEVMAILRRALQKRPEDRFQSVAELISALERVQQQALGSASAAPRPRALPAERRQVTVVCCVMGRLASADEAGEDVDSVSAAHRAFHRICEDAVTRANGRVLSSTGGKLLACFGYPVAHEDDAQRAVRAALSVTAQVRALQRALFGGGEPSAGVGIHTGQAIVGGGDEWSSGVTAIQGEVPRVAEEIAAVASPHQVLVSPRVKKLLGGTFVTSEVLPGKGFQAAKVLHSVEREQITESRFEGSSPVHQSLVGREAELERLRALWAAAYASRGSFVLVEGDAGIGKSRLVHALKKEVASQEATHMTCQAWAHFSNSALMPLITLLWRSMGILRDQPPEARLQRLEQGLAGLGLPLADHVPVLAPLLGIPTGSRYPPIPAAASPAQVKAKTFQSLAALLFQTAERRPTLLVVEDLHWIDPSTLEFLSVIFERVPAARMLVVLTYRPTFRPPWPAAPHLHHVALDRFSQGEAAAMVEALSHGNLPREVVQTLVAGTDGIPLFIEELTRTVMDAGAAGQRSPSDGPIAIPASLNELLLARLDVLDRAEREVLQMAAVLGRSFDRGLIRRAAQLADKTLADTLDRLVDQGFLVSWEDAHEHGEPARMYSFKHALIQAAAYHSLVRAQRQRYHAIVATLLLEQLKEQVELQPELLAHHFAEAGDSQRALDWWEKAGHLAARRSANHEAEHHFGNALALLRADPRGKELARREFELLIAMGASLMATHGYASAEVRDTYARATELCQVAGGSRELITALLGIWQSHMSTGRILTSLDVAKELVGLAEGLEESEALVPAYRALGTSYFLKGELQTALRHIQHSIQLHDRVAHRGSALRYGQDHGVIARLYQGWTFQLLGLPDRALASVEEALSLAAELGHAHSRVFAECYAMMVMQQRGDFARIRDLAPKTLEACAEHRFMLWVGWATVERGYAAARLGGGKEAIADIRAGIEAWTKTGAISGQTYLLPLLADALRRAGRIPEAAEVIGQSRALIERTGERMNDANVALLQAEIATDQEPPDREAAERWSRYGLEVARAQGARSPELRLCTARYRWARERGGGAEERKALEAAYAGFQEGFDTEDLRVARRLLDGAG